MSPRRIFWAAVAGYAYVRGALAYDPDVRHTDDGVDVCPACQVTRRWDEMRSRAHRRMRELRGGVA